MLSADGPIGPEEENLAKKEIHGYRDEELKEHMALWIWIISQRHRKWGPNCIAYDIDFADGCNPTGVNDGTPVFMEGSWGKVHSLTEFKHENILQNLSKAAEMSWVWQIRYYKDLARGSKIPFFCCLYRTEDFSMRVIPANSYARLWVPEETWMSEREWVILLHEIRGITASERDLRCLNDTCPGREAQYRLVV